MKKTDSAYITIGKIGSTYGVSGWIKIQPYTEFGADILEFDPWYLTDKDGNFTVIEIEESRVQGKNIIAKFAGIHTPEKARHLTGKTISITRSQLPSLQEGEYYWSDLIGLTVINKGEIIGKVAYVLATGSNDVFVVKGQKEQAIPYLPEVIKKIDLDKQEIHIDWDFI